MRVILLVNDPDLVTIVRECLRPEDRLEPCSVDAIVDDSARMSAYGRDLVESMNDESVLLSEWIFHSAPALNLVSHRLRERRMGPTIMLCSDGERPEALAAGADAVLGLPFSPDHLEALVLAHRRILQVAEGALRDELGAEGLPKPVLEVGGIRLDRSGFTLTVGERSTRITPRETGLLAYLMTHVGQTCTREELLANVWGIRFDTGTNMVDVYVFFVRRKLEALGHTAGITTVRGAGYRLEKDTDAEKAG